MGIVSVPRLDSAGNFTGTQTPGTNIHMAGRAIDHCLNALDIGLPGTIGTSVGMGNLDTKGHALATKITLSHFIAPPIIEFLIKSAFSQALRYDTKLS